MRSTLIRLAVVISAFVILSFVVVLANQTIQLSQAAAAYGPRAHAVVLYGLLGLYALLVLTPVVLYLRLPKRLEPPASLDAPEYPRFLQQVQKRLAGNPRTKRLPLDTREQVAVAIRALDNDADAAVRAAASSIFLTTAVLQSGRLDMLVVLGVQTRLVWQIAHIYYQRPSLRELLQLYANVAATAFVAGQIEDVDMDQILAAVFGSSAMAIPGTQLVAHAMVTASANAFLTLRVGMVTKRYCNALVHQERRFIKRSATLEAARLVTVIVKDNSKRLMKAAGSAAAGKVWPWSRRPAPIAVE